MRLQQSLFLCRHDRIDAGHAQEVKSTLYGLKCHPFLERDGLYWANPADDRVAIEELERLRRRGVEYTVLAKPAFWWLEYYIKFWEHIESMYKNIVRKDNLMAF